MKYLLSYLLDFGKMFAIMVGILGFKPKKTIKTPVIALSFTAVYLVMIFTVKNESIQAAAELLYILSAVFAAASAVEGRKKLIICMAACMFVQVFDDLFSMAAAAIAGVPHTEINRNFTVHYLLMTGVMLMYAVIGILMTRRRKRLSDKQADIREVSNIYFLAIAAAVFLCYTIGAVRREYFSLLTGAAVFSVLVFVIIQNNAGKKYYEQNSRLNEKLMQQQKAYYEQRLVREEETRKFRHDIKNHMLCIKTLLEEGNYDDAKEYIAGIENRTESLRPAVITGNSLVDAITCDIMEKHSSVRLEWEGHLPDKIKLSDMDICVIFSNILDNAFAAAAKCNSGSVKVRAAAAGSSLMITVINDIIEPIELRDSKLVTSKPDKRSHGYGVMNVKECAEKNGGKAEFSFDEKHFTAEVILPDTVPV